MGRNDNENSFFGKLHRRSERVGQEEQANLSESLERTNITPQYTPAGAEMPIGANLDQKSQYQSQPNAPPYANEATFAGSSTSAASSSFSTDFASISLHMTDRIRLLDFPHETVHLVRLVLQRDWYLGVQEERDYYGSWEFKLHGRPWSVKTDTEQATNARRLVRGLLATLYDAGWILALSTDVSKKQTDKDTLIFRHQNPAPAKCEWMSIDFARGDRLRVIDAPRAVLDAIYAQLQPAIQEQVRAKMPGMWELKLHGYPWRAVGGETMNSRRILLHLFAVLERFGFTVYASVDQESTTQDNTSETDTWHCLRPIAWTPGAPVYHG